MAHESRPHIGPSDILICILLTVLIWWMGPAYITVLDEIGWAIVATASFFLLLAIFYAAERFAGRDLSFDIVRLPFSLLTLPFWPLKYLDSDIELVRRRIATNVAAGWMVGGAIWVAVFAIVMGTSVPFPSECHEDNCVLVVGLQGDSPVNGRSAHARDALKTAFRQAGSNQISVVTVPRSLFRVAWGNPEQAHAFAAWQARFWHGRLGSTVLIYGRVSPDGRTQEFHAIGREDTRADSALMLPHYFRNGYGSALALYAALHGASDCVYAQSVLWPLIVQVRPFVADLPKNIAPETKQQILLTFAAASSHVGEVAGNVEAMRQTVWADHMLLNQHIGDWAVVQTDLGKALSALGASENGAATYAEAQRLLRKAKQESKNGAVKLAAAVTAYREALGTFNRKTAPAEWANTQLLIGKALANLGQRLAEIGDHQASKARLTEAVIAFRESLKVFTYKAAPREWAMAQFGIGEALSAIAMRETEGTYLADAATAYRETLKVDTLARDPDRFAATQASLGKVLLTLGVQAKDPAALTGAVDAYRAALKGYAHNPQGRSTVQEALGDAQMAKIQIGDAQADFEGAATAYRAAIDMVPREEHPLRWAVLQNKLVETLIESAKRGSDTAKLEQVLTILSETAAFADALDESELKNRVHENRAVAEKMLAERIMQKQLAPAPADATPAENPGK